MPEDAGHENEEDDDEEADFDEVFSLPSDRSEANIACSISPSLS